MRKEFEIQGCIEVPPEVTEDEFWDAFIEFVESKGWSFGGGIQEIQDGYYILADGSRGQYVLDECEHEQNPLDSENHIHDEHHRGPEPPVPADHKE